jgi:hypothetical protein
MSTKNTSKLSVLILIALAVACSGAEYVADSPEARVEIASTLARLSIETGSLDQTLNSGADLAFDYTEEALKVEIGRELTDDEKAQVRAIIYRVLGEFLTGELWQQTLTEIFAENFTASELAETLAFFESPTGRKILETEAVMNREIDDRADEVLTPRLEEFSDRIDEELAKAFPSLGGGE